MPLTFGPQLDVRKKPGFIKRHPVLFPIIVLFVLLISISLVSRSATAPSLGVVAVEGVILESEPTIRKLRQLQKNPSVKGIIVRINSPGGAVAPSQEIFSELLRLRKHKKVFVSISSVAASGGYYIAVGSDRIFANPGSLTGSIGVIMQSYNIEELLSRVGVKPVTIKSGKNKDLGSMFRPLKKEERKLLESVLQNTHEQFIEAVAENRTIDLEQVTELADGRVFTGKQAAELGLVDELAGFREVVEKMRNELNIQKEVELIYAKDEEKLFQQLGLEGLLPDSARVLQTGLFYLLSLSPG